MTLLPKYLCGAHLPGSKIMQKDISHVVLLVVRPRKLRNFLQRRSTECIGFIYFKTGARKYKS